MLGRGVLRTWPALASLVLLAVFPAGNVDRFVQVSAAHAGWTISADSEQTAGSAANAIDGDPSTFWTSASGRALPHTLTLDTGTQTPLAGLLLTPRQDGTPDGNLGQFLVETSVQGTWWRTVAGGQLADTMSTKSVYFAATTARYLRLTARSEAGGRGTLSSLAELDLITDAPAAPAAGKGSWGLPFNTPVVGVSAALLKTGKVLLWSASSPDAYTKDTPGFPAATDGLTYSALLDPGSEVTTESLISNTGHDMFCPGTAVLADGRVLVQGGSSSQKSSIYDPVTQAWTASTPMALKRGYQAAVTLGNGKVFSIGGSWYDMAGGKDGELWTPGATHLLTGAPVAPILTADKQGAFRTDNHAWTFAWTGNRVFHAGPSKAMGWYGTAGEGSYAAAGVRGDDADAMNGGAVMYAAGKLLTTGGAPDYERSVATNHAYTIDITTTPPTVVKLAGMATPRAFATDVVLPDGQVLVVGGQKFAQPFTDDSAELRPELWNPATGAFTLLAPMLVPRNYHSIALLLPDARVLTAGGGLCGQGCTTNHPDAQVFTPPYLLSATGRLLARPVITSAPTAARVGALIRVQTKVSAGRYSLVRMASVTHGINNDQRRIALRVIRTQGTAVVLGLPKDPGVLVPGPYMLFALDSRGTPSVAKILQIT
jgi:galactose oxidase